MAIFFFFFCILYTGVWYQTYIPEVQLADMPPASSVWERVRIWPNDGRRERWTREETYHQLFLQQLAGLPF